eukprot:scaffold2821_cov47-Attheya_sp.AAC.2
MLGAENGSTDIDGEDEGLIDGPILVVGVDDDSDTLGNVLASKDGAIDSDGNPLGSVVGLIDGPILCVGGSLEFSLGESDTVGRRLPLNDGPIDADGIPLVFIVGEILTLGPMLGLETGSNDSDGCNEGDGGVIVLTDGAVLTLVGLTLGLSVGKCETDGSELTLGWLLGGEVGPMDNVGFDEGVSLRESDGAWLGLRDTDGCMLGFKFGSITLNVRSNASLSNPGS